MLARQDYLRERGERLVPQIEAELIKTLKEGGLEAQVSGREKTPYSIWRKMQNKNVSFEQLADIMAFRIIVADVAQCYQALGLLHGRYQVIPGRFKDYISVPKPNGYRSLHTGVIGPLGQRIEIQIRTEEMQDQAERGVAAHWIYKQGGPVDRRAAVRLAAQPASRSSTRRPTPEEFLEHTKLEMFHDQVFCFTPKGKLIALPQAARRRSTSPTPCTARSATPASAPRSTAACCRCARSSAERRPGRDHHLEGADAVADLGALRRHRQGQGRDPPLHPHAPARAVPAARQVAARQDLPRGGLRGHREGPRRRARQLQAGHHRRPDRRGRRGGLITSREVMTAVYPGLKQPQRKDGGADVVPISRARNKAAAGAAKAKKDAGRQARSPSAG